MVTTRSKDSKRTALPGSTDAGAGSKREVPPESNKSPPPKHQKQAAERDDKNGEPVKRDEPESKATGAAPEKDEKKPASKQAEAKPETKETDASPGDETATVQEKGLIYFFTRPRVSVEEPKSIADIARSFFVLRPTDGDKPPARDGQSRLCIVPKKVLPTSGRQRWIGFVEKGNEPWYKATGEDVEGREYETKTTGHRHVPDAIQAGEGMYAITKADRAANLVYVLTEPKELGEVQVELGLKDRGYFTISTRNPVYPAPKGTGIQGGAEYPQEIMDDFQSRRWIPTQPRHLDYPKTQFLLIGHSSGIQEAFKPDTKGAAEKKPAEDEVTIKEEPIEGEEDLMYDIREDEVSDVLLHLEKYAHSLRNVETEF